MKLKCISWIFRIASFADRLIGRVSQRIVLIGSVSILLEDVISVFIFSRVGGLNAFVIFGCCRRDDLRYRRSVGVQSDSLRTLDVIHAIGDGDHGEHDQRRDLNDVDGQVHSSGGVDPGIRDPRNEERKDNAKQDH